MIKYYYEDKTKKELTTKLLESFEENGKYFARLEDSIFYPQGGGQKGDRGYLIIGDEKYNIINTIKDENYNSILIVDRLIDIKYIGQAVTCFLDWNFRYRQMRLHTALHLYHYTIESIKGSAVDYPLASNIEDGFAYNKYDENSFDMSILDKVNEMFYDLIKTDNQVKTYPDLEKEHYRWWECMNYKVPCGGVHVDKLSEIGNVNIETYHKKKVITIKFTFNEA